MTDEKIELALIKLKADEQRAQVKDAFWRGFIVGASLSLLATSLIRIAIKVFG